MQVPHLQEFDDTPLYNTRAIVRMTQVKAPRLRAWERRYAVLSPRRTANDYRLYSERDIAIVRWLREQIEAGLTVSQAIVMLRTGREAPEPILPVVGPPVEQPLSATPHNSLEVLSHRILVATGRLDEEVVRQCLREAFALHTVEEVCQFVIVPALAAIGDAWAQQGDVIMQEHFLSAIVHAQIEAIWHATANPTDGPLTLVGCVAGELHDLGSLVMALYLRRAGLRVAYFGANIDTPSLIRLMKTMRPAAVCLSVTLPTNMPAALDAFRQILHVGGAQLFIGGQAALPPEAEDISTHAVCLGANGMQGVMRMKRILAPS